METTIDLPVLGMTCAACVRRVEKAVLAVPGVVTADVNLLSSRARIAFDPERASTRDAAAAIRGAGYEIPADVLETAPGGQRLAAIERAHDDETAGLRRDATIAIAATVPLIAIAMAQLTSVPGVVAQLALGTIVVLGPGMRYLRGGVRAVSHRSPDMNTLIALGAGAAWLSSLVLAVRWLAQPAAAAPELYFEAGAAIIAFVMIGKLLEARARSKLVGAVHGLLSLAPATASRDGQDVPAASLEPGEVIRIRPGERIAADGTVIEGRSAVDEAMLTGESLPIDKTEGAAVYAGTLNIHGALQVRVARAGTDTALARIARAVEDAQGTKAPIARLADRASAVFVPIVLAIAAATFGGWLIAGAEAADALQHAIAVLVIACPCALGLATPAAVAVGTSRGAELGVLFRDGRALEAASRIRIACLDKTGTLTRGTPQLVGTPDPEMLRLAASVEQASEHPMAKAIVAAARERGLALSEPTEVANEPGAGMAGLADGHRVLVGTREYLALAGVELPASQDRAASEGNATLCHVAIDGSYRGAIAIADPASPVAVAAIARLRELGVEPVMVTGDAPGVANAIARDVGIETVHARITPLGKAALVRELRARGPVAMVGDGVNDAPALAAADLGVAIGSGTDLAAAVADVTLLREGIGGLPVALSLARATLRVIRRNLIAASIYNVLAIPIAAAGLLSPMFAAAAMSLSSVSVLISSLALRRAAPVTHIEP